MRTGGKDWPAAKKGAHSILRRGSPFVVKVAQVCVESIFRPETNNQILEIVAKPEAPTKNWDELFASFT